MNKSDSGCGEAHSYTLKQLGWTEEHTQAFQKYSGSYIPGRVACRQKTVENCSIALLSRRENILKDLANDLWISRVHVRAYKCDVGNVNEVRNIFSQVLNDFGKIDVTILNAGASSELM